MDQKHKGYRELGDVLVEIYKKEFRDPKDTPEAVRSKAEDFTKEGIQYVNKGLAKAVPRLKQSDLDRAKVEPDKKLTPLVGKLLRNFESRKLKKVEKERAKRQEMANREFQFNLPYR